MNKTQLGFILGIEFIAVLTGVLIPTLSVIATGFILGTLTATVIFSFVEEKP